MALEDFDFLGFIKKPHVIARCVSWLFSVIVFGCILNQGWTDGMCAYNHEDGACGFPTAIGILGFLAVFIFLAVDSQFDSWSNILYRRYYLISDIVFSAIWSFLWFVAFCYTASAWGRGFGNNSIQNAILERVRGNMQAAIAFSLFSVFSWGVSAFLAVRRYRLGAAEDFTTGWDQAISGGGGGPNDYSSYPAENNIPDSYQAPPFSDKTAPQSGGGFQQTY